LSSVPQPARHAAVALLTEAKALGGVARHGQDAGTRLLALERLTEAGELEAVATNGEHADAAVAALDRLPTPGAEQLAAIAQRARTKAVAKRAKALLAAVSAVPAPAEAAPTEYKDADQDTARALVLQMQALSGSSDASAVRDGYAAARVAWVELLADAEVRPAIVEEFETLSDRVRTAMAADDAELVASAQAGDRAALDRLLPPGRVDYETRPYQAGWLLYAYPREHASRA